MKHRQFFTIILSAALLSAVAFAADSKVPETFLPSSGRLREALDKPVSGTFRDAHPKDVVHALCMQLPVNHAYGWQRSKLPILNFTGTFKNTPLRTALYQVCQATHITVELVDRDDGGKFLSFSE